ncbi:MAG: DUF2164 domain-containing protein [Pseudomonadales bacterium]
MKLDRQHMDPLVDEVKKYFERELDHNIGGFEAQFLIEFMASQLGHHFYNQGLSDAQTLFNEQTQELNYKLQELEKVP